MTQSFLPLNPAPIAPENYTVFWYTTPDCLDLLKAHKFMIVGRMVELVDGVGAVAISLDGGSPAYSAPWINPLTVWQFCVWESLSAHIAASDIAGSSLFADLCGVRKPVGVVADNPVFLEVRR